MGFWQRTGQCFIIAEIGVNHNGDLNLAKQLIDVAAKAGADAVKFQTFKADRLATRSAGKAGYQKASGSGPHESQLEMLRGLELSQDAMIACRDHCGTRKIQFLSTPFDEDSADLLEQAGVEGFKIASGDLTNLPFLAHVARKAKPMIISTGMSDMAEVEDAVSVVRANGSPPLALLHCVSNYPAEPADCNLRAMQTLEQAFNVPVGWSDHTLGDAVALAAAAMGARILEKHFTLDRELPGPDHKASLTPDELEQLVRGVRIVEAALGDGVKRARESERDTARVARRSIAAARFIMKGEIIREADLARKRPGTGLAPKYLDRITGRRAARNIEADELIGWPDIVEP